MGTELRRWLMLEAMYQQLLQQALRVGRMISREEFMVLRGGIAITAADAVRLGLAGLENVNWQAMIPMPQNRPIWDKSSRN